MASLLSMTAPVPSQSVALRSPTTPVPAMGGPQMREFGDSPATRQLIFDNVLTAAKQLPPLENKRHTLALQNVGYHGREHFSIAERKNAILTGGTLARKLRGTWVLRNKETGEELDRKQTTLAQVPYLTNDGTFVDNGNEYTLGNQLRLMPGSFARVKDNGEIESHANILPGSGRAHRYFLDPARGVFNMRIEQAKIPLFPLLRALGANDRQLQEAWGSDLFATNSSQTSAGVLNKFYEKFVRNGNPEATPEERQQALVAAFNKMEIDPEVSQRTLGKKYDRLNLDAILDTTKKLLAISRGEADIDDRDHLAFQRVLGPEDLFAERLTKDYQQYRRQLFNRASWEGNLSKIPAGALTRQLRSALLHSGLGNALEEINPADVFDKQFRVSRMGEGGISSLDAVPDESRAVQPSHLGYIDPLRTPESAKVGVDIFVSSAAKKGKDGRLYIPFQHAKTKQTVWKSPQDVADLAIATPQSMAAKTKRVQAMHQGRIRYVPRENIDLVLPHFEKAFSPLANLIPAKSTNKGQRMAMASRMLTQALPLTKAEAPLVQSGVPDDEGMSYEHLFGKHMGALRSDDAGRVVSVSPDAVVVRYHSGGTKTHELFNNFPYNRKTFVHQTPLVEPGQTIKRGDLLARSNYTDDKGVTALGVNARVAYMPFRGLNFEDAVVISQSMAKEKLSSEHAYQHRVDYQKEDKTNRNDFLALFPGKYDRKQMETLNDHGVVQVGTEVQQGDPLILTASPRSSGHHKIHRRKAQSFEDNSLTWKHHQPGVVTDVVTSEKGTTVLVKSVMPMQVGDKVSGRYGDKGIVSAIVPDEEMPHDENGFPVEMLIADDSVQSRTNPGQVVEALLGKVAAQRGKPFVLKDFEDIEDLTAYAWQEVRKAGLQSLDTMIDPETGVKIPGILTGNRFFMKLHHMAEGKGQGRSTGGYTMDELPAKGGEAGSKIVSLMDMNALLSHGATEVIRDAAAVRGQRNEDYMLSFMQGYTPPEPKVPFVFRKFVNELKAAGINVVPDGGQLQIMALTDSDVDNLAGSREITTGATVRLDKGLEPVAGGLFDERLTGGHHGNRWSAIKLEEPMPNPVMEEPIRRMLGLTQKRFTDIVACRDQLDHGCGPEAIDKALKGINVDRAIAVARQEIAGGRKGKRDAAVRRLGYLKTASRLGIHPQEWMMNRVPVLPPMFRPISLMEDSDIPIVSDPNYLYKELLDANGLLRDMKKEIDDVGDERLAVYNAFKAVTGLGDPVHPKLQEKRVSGILKHIFGSSPKLGTVQRRLISSPTDFVGRAVISPDPDLDMDHVGLPETRAWDVYRDFIIRRLRQKGLPFLQASQHVEDRTEEARSELLKELEHRPVYITRAPVLHKFGVLAFWPRLVKGDTLKVSPLIVKGFGADFDGDAMNYNVPVADDARQEAIDLMLPSRNLFSPADFKKPMHMPGQQYVAGLHRATSRAKNKKQTPRYFENPRAVLRAFARGEITADTPIRIGD